MCEYDLQRSCARGCIGRVWAPVKVATYMNGLTELKKPGDEYNAMTQSNILLHTGSSIIVMLRGRSQTAHKEAVDCHVVSGILREPLHPGCPRLYAAPTRSLYIPPSNNIKFPH